MKSEFKLLNIQYETRGLPPPFSYQLNVECSPKDGALQVIFAQRYTHRDEVEEEEILAEGFTGNDDFQWQGQLPEVWLKRVEQETNAVTIIKGNSELQLEIIDENQKLAGQPKNDSIWEYLVQELTQAVFEQSKKEMPLQLGIMFLNDQKKKKIQWMEYRFAQLTILDEKGQKVMGWGPGHNLLQLIFMLDFEVPEAKNPHRSGYYLDPGDGYWYLLGTGAKNPHPDNDVENKIINMIEDHL